MKNKKKLTGIEKRNMRNFSLACFLHRINVLSDAPFSAADLHRFRV